MRQYFGYDAEEVIGQNIKMIMPDPYHSQHDGCLNNYKTSGDKKIIGSGREVLGKRKDGDIFPIDLSVSEVLVNGKTIYSGIVRDITEKKSAEDKIQRYIDDLKKSNQDLDDYAYIATHDLKEPLRGFLSNILFLKEDHSSTMDADALSRVERITYLCKRMDAITNDLLYFERLGRQEFSVQRVDILTILDDLKKMMAAIPREETLEIILADTLPKVLECDKSRITELFQNLITNAVKCNNSNNKVVEVG